MRRGNEYIRGLAEDAMRYEKEESERTKLQFFTNAVVEDGIVRWKSNNQVPPTEILEFWKYIGYEFDYDRSLEVREKEQNEFLEKYRESQKNRRYTEEEIYEMRAAFGEGATVVDIISGKKIKL